MALQASGTIKFSEISAEFGLPPGKNLGAYRVSENNGSLLNMPLDAGIPQSVSIGSSTIKFSDFYSKRLNIVVDFYSGSEETRGNGRSRYIDKGVRVVGGFRSRPDSSSGTKVFINVNKDVGSTKSSDYRYVALRTGSWDSGTTLTVDIGGSGRLFGAGGDGGRGGGTGSSPGSPGGNGTSALGIEYSGTTVNNRGYIQCGYGGGGGGGGAASDPNKNPQDHGSSGGGGGGGAGFPAGGGGSAGGSSYGSGGGGNPGSSGTKTTRGAGGSGGSGGGANAGGGGPGGDPAVGASPGGGGSGNRGGGSAGSAGGNGVGIINPPSVPYSLNNFATINGGTANADVL